MSENGFHEGDKEEDIQLVCSFLLYFSSSFTKGLELQHVIIKSVGNCLHNVFVAILFS